VSSTIGAVDFVVGGVVSKATSLFAECKGSYFLATCSVYDNYSLAATNIDFVVNGVVC
jgi:hypothetical protein